jgi:ribosomal protein S18 acetylase RimI-like enzyme
VRRIEELGFDHALEIYNIISEHQKQLQNTAQLNWKLESIVEILKSSRAIGFIQQAENSTKLEILAFIIFRDLKDISEVLLLGTKLEQQSQGLMKALFAKLKEDYQEIWLEVHELNIKAFRLYERELFNVDGVRPKYYTDGKAALVMSWKRVLAIC